MLSTLPLFTISDELLDEILKNNGVSKEETENIIKYKHSLTKDMSEILKNSLVIDNVYEYDKNEECYLELDGMFYTDKIKYTHDEYMKHLNMTKKFSKKCKNYSLEISNSKTFSNITISILEDKYVIISKSSNPVIHFVIRHSKLVEAISNFRPLVIEKQKTN